MKTYACSFLSLLAVLSAFAYLPPEASDARAFLRIEGLDQTIDTNRNVLARKLGVASVDADRPRDIPFTLENRSGAPLTGTLVTWMNDDWTLSGPKSERVALAPGEKRTIVRTATAKRDRILNALYPVHATFAADGASGEPLHPVAVFEAKTKHPARAGGAARNAPALRPGVVNLTAAFPYRTFVEVKGQAAVAVDAETMRPYGAAFTPGRPSHGGEPRAGFSTHPPYRKGAGFVYADFDLDLPDERPLRFTCGNALRRSGPKEGTSDGVEYKVLVRAGDTVTEVAGQIVTARDAWQPLTADLTPWAGQRITLRLWTGPGPKMNTSCDGGAWGCPALEIGTLAAVPTEAEWTARERAAVAAAKAALAAGTDAAAGRYRLEGGRDGTWAAAFVPGPCGPVDGVLAVTDGRESLAWRGFVCEVDGSPVRVWDARLRVRFTADRGALRMRFDMPGAARSADGFPRYTRLGLGPCALPAKRIYAGFGNVIENPRNCVLGSGGFTLSTRHVGADYANGLSFVQATDIAPDNATCRRDAKVFSLFAHHDTTFTFVLSSKGAFAAARAFADVSGYVKSPGFDSVSGRQCLDQWGGDYGRAADGLALAGKYGLNDSIFVKHVWQRWGYDYRLPEIYPPMGDNDAFRRMVKASQDAGILFAPHDNYIDFYPDAEDYTYNSMVFNLDGTPQRAWFNHGRLALSYRWAPHVFRPWLVRNMRRLRDGFGPDGLFIDVFTAISPMDYLDRNGVFHPKSETTKCWGDAFDTCRVELGKPTAPMISEAGQDHLIGHLDAGQSDHFHASRWMSTDEFDDAERTPWHDIVTHGRFVLFAGGLGGRYEAPAWHVKGDTAYNGYGSDDYLCNTVIGGRTPMSDGPFSRRAVKTYWMLHDLCKNLGAASFESLDYGENIHRQHAVFGNGAEVWINRETNRTWSVAGATLPPYGFLARAPGVSAGVVEQDGQRIGWSKTAGRWFVDARTPHGDGLQAQAASRVTGARIVSPRQAVLNLDWEAFEDLSTYRPFVHVCGREPNGQGERIVFQCALAMTKAMQTPSGVQKAEVRVDLPANLAAGEYDIRYGMYLPKVGRRLVIRGDGDGGGRIDGGVITVTKDGDAFTRLAWADEHADRAARDRLLGVNRACRPMDFGGIVTDGSFRFDFASVWRIVPMPDSLGFTATIDLASFGAKGRTVASVTAVEPKTGAAAPVWRQSGDRLTVTSDARSFACDIVFRDKLQVR